MKANYRFTSSADWARKNPTVITGSLDLLGFIEILGSPPSSGFTSIARSRSFSFTKHSLIYQLFLLNQSLLFQRTLSSGKTSSRQTMVTRSPCTSHSRCPADSHSARRPCPDSEVEIISQSHKNQSGSDWSQIDCKSLEKKHLSFGNFKSTH